MRPADPIIRALDSCRYGTIVSVGRKRFSVIKAPGSSVYATAEGSKGRKLYNIRPVGPDSDQVEVWEMFNVTPIRKTLTGAFGVEVPV